MEPDPIERIGQGTAGVRTSVIEVVARIVPEIIRMISVVLMRLARGLLVVPVAWPHRRASVPTTAPIATAGRRRSQSQAGGQGGSFRRLFAVPRPMPDERDWVALTPEPLPATDAQEWATVPSAGAVVTFSGVVRDHAEGRPDVVGMTYEAYAGPAERSLREIAAEIRRRWPDVERIALLHRTGELQLSEASVVVVVSAPHRGAAFAAAEFAIDTLKETAPIWKQEHWAGGSDWAVEQHPIRSALSASEV